MPYFIAILMLFACNLNLLAQDNQPDPSRQEPSQPGEQAGETKDSIQDIRQFRDQLHRWERIIRGFRSDHHLSLGIEYDKGEWKGRFRNQDAFAVNTSIAYASLTYSFHIELWQGLGYFVGTRAGYSFLEDSQTDNFEAPNLIKLPGVYAGLVWNPTPVFSSYLSIEGSLVRIERFSPSTEVQRDRANVTAQVLTYRFGIDLFIQMGLALRLETGSYELDYQPKTSNQNSSEIRRFGKNWSFGLVRHLI